MKIISDFGIEPILLAAQIINFAILLFILKKYLYKPILKILDERRKKVETSLKQAEEIQIKYESANDKSNQIIDKAKTQALEIITGAKEEAKMLHEQIQKDANSQANQTLERAKGVIRLEKEKMISDAKRELVDLVALTTEKITPNLLNKKNRDQLIKSAAEEIEG